MVKHIILWQLKDEYSDAEKADIKAGIKGGLEGRTSGTKTSGGWNSHISLYLYQIR